MLTFKSISKALPSKTSLAFVTSKTSQGRQTVYYEPSIHTHSRTYFKMATQSIHLYSHVKGPNPWKVATILEELGLPYEMEFVNPAELHTPVYEKVR